MEVFGPQFARIEGVWRLTWQVEVPMRAGRGSRVIVAAHSAAVLSDYRPTPIDR